MVNYKSIVEFFEEVALSEGRTDIQNHVGFMNIHNSTAKELAENAFGGRLELEPRYDISEFDQIIYVYVDDAGDYICYAGDNFSFNDDHHFQVRDADGQRILCWAVGV